MVSEQDAEKKVSQEPISEECRSVASSAKMHLRILEAVSLALRA
jgi:hypothetical protein